MSDYRLDDLGWYPFERLIQTLLKAEFGIGIESWGNSGDFGRDAYSAGPLTYPSAGALQDGPFVFQVKHVAGAAAAGARPFPALKAAIGSEAKRIQNFIDNGDWSSPRVYTLITNVPLTGTRRRKIAAALGETLPDTTVVTLGAKDVSDMLNARPAVRRSFPQVLGIRDLDLLVREAANRSTLERSSAALDESSAIVPVFVPTGVYYEAWERLKDHAFVVLDGPPEVGKTSIAWMIGLIKLLDGWQVLDCRNPDDFFRSIDGSVPQVFVVDDAFGRTEYDPTLARLWERDLGRAYRRLDDSHWLVWTTRKHILTRAVLSLDLAGSARRFPDPGEVTVTAADLTVEEKALILYRHAKAARLPSELRKVIRQNAKSIVADDHFTPERIRRLVTTTLPSLAGARLGPTEMASAVHTAIRDPTPSITRTLAALDSTHFWVLICLLDTAIADKPSLLRSYERMNEPVSSRRFTALLSDLEGTFIRQRRTPWGRSEYAFVHPSYRDATIEFLADDLSLQNQFLRNSTLAGIRLAISTGGGAEGGRTLPLARHRQSLETIAGRIRGQLEEAPQYVLAQILDILTAALSELPDGDSRLGFLQDLLCECCIRTAERWDGLEENWYLALLPSWKRAAQLLPERPQEPNVEKVWTALTDQLDRMIEEGFIHDSDVLSQWIDLASYLSDSVNQFEGAIGVRLRAIPDLIRGDLQYELSKPTEADIEAEEDRLSSLARAVEEIALFPSQEGREEDWWELMGEVEAKSESYQRPTRRPPEDDMSAPTTADEDFPIEEVFSDL